MNLLPLDSPARIELAARWLQAEENARWLDFGSGVQRLSPVALRIMNQRDIHLLRLYTGDGTEAPAGIVGLANIDRHFRTASVWCVLGDKRFGGCSARAVSKMLTVGFQDLGLEAISAWTVEVNIPAQKLIARLPFTYVGRLRRCHWIDGRPYDRLLFDMLASEHREI